VGDEIFYEHNGVKTFLSKDKKKIHRDNDLPAIVHIEGNFYEWYNQGSRERYNKKPAVIIRNRSFDWYINDKLQSVDGEPCSIIIGDSHPWNLIWAHEGRIHNNKGPAVLSTRGMIEFFLNGTKYNFKSWLGSVNITEEEKLELYIEYANICNN
jgi:hypothetical protein